MPEKNNGLTYVQQWANTRMNLPFCNLEVGSFHAGRVLLLCTTREHQLSEATKPTISALYTPGVTGLQENSIFMRHTIHTISAGMALFFDTFECVSYIRSILQVGIPWSNCATGSARCGMQSRLFFPLCILPSMGESMPQVRVFVCLCM